MLSPTEVREWAQQRLSRQRGTWLDGGGTWPLVRGVEPPSAAGIRVGLEGVTRWTAAWAALHAAEGVRVVRETRQMRDIGVQTMPVRVEFDSPRAVAKFAGSAAAWDRVVSRRDYLLQRWPQLSSAGTGLGKIYDWLEQASDNDVERLIAVASWVLDNPSSGLYLRQLPVSGVDTKWIEGGQKRAITLLIGLLRGSEALIPDSERDFLRLCGLRAPSSRVRLMVLDAGLRAAVGGLRDVQAQISELAKLAWTPRVTLFTENLTCAYSLPDLEATVAVVGLGRAVSMAAEMPWIHGSATLYWGDIDTDGLEILALARAQFPGMRSVLMDHQTLHRYRSRWVPEGKANHQADRTGLQAEELLLYEALLANEWYGWTGEQGVRLEQERLDWPHVEEALRQAVDSTRSSSKAL